MLEPYQTREHVLGARVFAGCRECRRPSSSLLSFFAVGLGFGWPLTLLPLIALPLQRRGVGWLTQRHTLLTRVSGVLLLGIGVFGVLTELLPRL